MKHRSAPFLPTLRELAGTALVGSLACLLGTTTDAQGMSASESGFTPVQSLNAAGGLSLTVTGNQSTASLSQLGTGAEATSTNYLLQDSVAWSPSVILPTGPIITGVREGSGDKDGGETVTVFGFNFDAVGAGIHDVQFDGNPGTNASVLSNTMISVQTPASLNSLGNTIGASSVTVTNSLGSDDTSDAFYFEPALVQATHAQLGRTLQLRLQTSEDAIPFYLFGLSIPDFGIATPPFDGQLECILQLLFVSTAIVPATAGVSVQKIPVPKTLPTGVVLEFQALSIDDFTLTSGSWSNRVEVTILP